MPAGGIFPDTELGRLCHEKDWAATPLGPVDAWSWSLKSAASTVLRQGLPQCLCWGSGLWQVYNDAFRVIMGDKHPGGLCMPVLECWAEVADTVGPLFERVIGGETISFDDLRLTVHRNGGDQVAYFTFSYSPVLDDAGGVGGALINCFETTDQVAGRFAQADREVLTRALAVEKDRLEAAFRQSPSFLAILRGPENVFDAINPAYEQIIGHGRDVIGKPLFEAIPETRGQGFDVFLGQVRETGEPLVFRDLPVMLERTAGTALEERFLDITYLPLIEADGSHPAVIAHGTDVTEQVRARRDAEALLAESEAARQAAEEAQVELELVNQQLQDNTLELEAQTEELQVSAAHLEERTEEAEAARRTISAIVEAVTDGFVAYDENLRYTYANARAGEMWGLAPAVLLGKTPHELWPGMDESKFVVMLRRVLETGKAEVLEGYSSSLRVPIELRAYPSRSGGLVVFFTDVTERRRAEAAATFLADLSGLLASSADYQTTLSNLAHAAVPRLGDWCAVDVLAEPDSDTWPPKIERVAVVHQDPAKVSLAQTLTTDFPQDWSRDTGTPGVIRTRQPLFIADVPDAMLTAGAQNKEHEARLRELNIHSIIIVPLVARERVLGTVTLVMSESERRFTDADLRLAVDLGLRAGVALDNARLLRDAEEANAAKTEFLRTVSHELRQPLNAMRGYVDLWRLGLRGDMTETMLEDIERISRNQEHLSVLIEDLLSFTRLDAGQLDIERNPVSVAAIFGALEAMMRPQMTTREVEFSYQACAEDLYALGDEDRIVQVLVNLLTNAMRATPAGGHVTLACVSDAASVVITVTDTGVGIPGDKVETIFTAFTQLGRSLNAPKEGAGLGLAISRGLAEAMGGTLTVSSVLGAGSTFSLTLVRANA
ncbi:MAG: ATP-binding region ATPase domain protein [Gemmatimonadetes bacterium]|nr:ATP-binding region ATPase domain protein [Gemmatimonadota bacterium]